MNIQKLQLHTLKDADYNPRIDLQPGDKEFERIRKSIEEFGYVQPLIVNADGTIISGHQRRKVMMSLGKTEADCVLVDVDKEKEKALAVAMNKVSGKWDEEKLVDLLQEMQEMDNDLDLDMMGFDTGEVDKLIAKFADTVDIDIDDTAEDEEQGEKLADTTMVVGPYRFKLDREKYLNWVNEIKLDVGFDDDAVAKEILRRLGLS